MAVKNKFLLFIMLLLLSSGAGAFTSVCELAAKPAPHLPELADQVAEYQKKMANECALSRAYQAVSAKVQDYGTTLESITGYQALRYVQRGFFVSSAGANLPIQLTYQRHWADYKKPVQERSSEVWDNWAVGILQMPGLRTQWDQGVPLSVGDLRRLHVGFYTLSDETGDFTNAPDIGNFKPINLAPALWWKFKTSDEAAKARAVVDEINRNYQRLGLEPDSGVTGQDPEINKMLSVRRLNGDEGILSGDPSVNPRHIEDLLTFLNEMLRQARAGQPMVWKNRLMTPAELAFFTQQFFVHIHAFSEGNGRMSRLLQEAVMTLFALPHGSSGDLMDIDALTNQGDYYKVAMDSTFKLLGQINNCVDQNYAPELRFQRKKVSRIEPHRLPYECRLIQPGLGL